MTFSDLKTDQRLIRFCIAGLLFAMITVSVYFDPANYSITDCSFKEITGYSCPSCGLTRSFHASANLHIAQAFAFHLLGPFFLLGSLLLFLKFAIESASGKTIKLKLNRTAIKTGILIIGLTWIIYWIVRLVFEIP